MTKGIAWSMLILGAAHIVFGIIRFKAPFADAVSAGFVGQFKDPEIRHTAFWFTLLGPLLMLVGHIAIRAVAVGDLSLLKIIGTYALVASVIGVAAFPMSPLWVLLVLSLFFIAAGYGRFS